MQILRRSLAPLLGLSMICSAFGSVSIVPGFSADLVIGNPDDAPLGSTTLASASRNSTGWKGNSFRLADSATITSVTFQLDNSPPIDTTGSLTLQFFRLNTSINFDLNGGAANGPIPAVPSPTTTSAADPDVLYEQIEILTGLPLASSSYVQIVLDQPLQLPPGDYGWFLTTDDLEIDLELRNDGAFHEGELLRWNHTLSTWQDRDNDLVFALGGTMKIRPPAGQGPNILFILADDLGWTSLSTGNPNLGNPSDFFQTPNIDQLASQGLSFTSAYVHQNCAPTRAALLSGQYPARSGNGVYVVDGLDRGTGTTKLTTPGQNRDLPASHYTLAEMLWDAGYVTCHVGKYHIGAHEGGTATLPENQGFDQNIGGNGTGAPGSYFATSSGVFASPNPAMDAYGTPYTLSYITNTLLPFANGNNPLSLIGSNKHLLDAEGDAILDFLAKHRSGPNSDHPFYLQYWSYGVHTPLEPRTDLKAKYDSIAPGALHKNAKYAALVEGLDQTIGRILTYLDKTGLATNTIVIFMSDNGGPENSTVNAPLRAFKGTFFEGGLRVPLIVRYPGRVPANEVTHALVHAVDLFPTLMEVAGGATTNLLDGFSFYQHALNPTANPRSRPPICYHYPGYLDDRARPCEVIIKEAFGKQFKLTYTYDYRYDPSPADNMIKVLAQPWELYNLTDDISEATNLVSNSYWDGLIYGGIADALADDLRQWLTQSTSGWNASQVSSNGVVVPFPPAKVPAAPPFPGQEFRLTAMQRLSSDTVAITFNSCAGHRFGIEATSNLSDWDALTNIIGQAGSTTIPILHDQELGPTPLRLYRSVLKWP